jgi:hypothetical protein
VHVLADAFEDAGAVVTTRGTERVFVVEVGATPDDARGQFLALLRAQYGHTFGVTYRDMRFNREVVN